MLDLPVWTIRETKKHEDANIFTCGLPYLKGMAEGYDP